jgi:nuclear transport factor 2 (NTF2) superfamily protein
MFAFDADKIAVQFWYEYYGEEEQSWFRCYGLGPYLELFPRFFPT